MRLNLCHLISKHFLSCFIAAMTKHVSQLYLIGALYQPVDSLRAGGVKLDLGLLIEVGHLGDHGDQLVLPRGALGQECHLEDGEELGELLGGHGARGEHLLDLGDQLGLALLVEKLRGADLHLGVDQSDGALPHNLVPGVNLVVDCLCVFAVLFFWLR